MTEEMYKRIDSIIEDYICNYDIFLAHNAKFFYKLYETKKTINVKLEPYSYQKISATNTFKKIEEFYGLFFPNDLSKIKEVFNNGKFDITYRDEDLELDDNYLSSKKETVFYENNDTINIPLLGDVRDIIITCHEIRHHLNHPKNSERSSINDLLTESLSQFEEYLVLEYFYNKGDICKDDRTRYYKEVVDKFNDMNNLIMFILKLIIIKQDFGTISKENYSFLFNSGTEVFESNCVVLLSDNQNFEQINEHFLGHFLDTYMIKQYEEDNNFLEKYKKLNQALFENSDIDCLNIIDLDFEDEEDTINKLSNSMKYIEDKVCGRKIK